MWRRTPGRSSERLVQQEASWRWPSIKAVCSTPVAPSELERQRQRRLRRLLRWSELAALSTGLGGPCSALAIAPDNSLYLGGTFTTAGGGSANRIAVWDGSAFAALGSGMDNDVSAIAISATGSSPRRRSVHHGRRFIHPHRGLERIGLVGARETASTTRSHGLFVDDAGLVYALGFVLDRWRT